MQEPFNPYAAPAATEMHSKAAEWLGTPSSSLRKVASGLALIRIGLILAILSSIVFVVGFRSHGLAEPAHQKMQTARIVFLGIVVLAQILNLIGNVFCLSAPPETQARGWVITSLVAVVLNMAVGLAQQLGLESILVVDLSMFLGITAYITFILFLRKLGQFIGRTDLSQRATKLLILGAVLMGLSLVLFSDAAVLMQANGKLGARGAALSGIGLFVAVSTFVVGITALFKYLSLLADMKSAILARR